jgi:signal transduction histidine kinase
MKSKSVILVVDDQPQNIELLEAHLVPQGYEIVKATNGEEALGKLSGNSIDLILLDVMMPCMDGFEVTRRIRQDEKNQLLPIILVTSLRETEDRVKGIEAGCDDFLSKPIDKLELLARIRSLLKVKAYNDLMSNYQKELESAVARKTEELEFLNTLLIAQNETSLDGINVVDEQRRIVFYNQNFINLWDIPSDVAESRSDERAVQLISDKVIDPENFIKLVNYLYEHRKEKRRDEIRLQDGRALDRFSAPMFSKDQHYYGRVWYARDITERKQAEDALRQNQQLQLQIRDQFLSRMSHELRSPLTPIHQFVTILLDGLVGDLNAEQREYLQIVLRNVNALRTMVNDLLETTRAESGKLNVDLHCVYLTELIPQILQAFQLANTKGLRISFDVPANLPPVCADPDRVRQILDNLLDNAIKYTPEKGGVSVQARVSNGNPGFLAIAVTDTGPGIDSSEHEKIFEYLYQARNATETNHRGLGIGLYICRELVSSHGGRIWVESQPGHGSTFLFTLPVFSLEGQIASIVKAADLFTHSIALITVEVSHIEKRPLKRIPDQAALRDAWIALEACTLPNLVVLLPRVPHAISKGFFFIVACVNQSSAEVLVEQLRNQLARCQSLRDYTLDLKVSFILLDTRSKRSGILSEDLVNKKVVDHIEDLIKATLHN